MLRPLIFRLFTLIILLGHAKNSAAYIYIKYPRPESSNDARNHYPVDLLNFILARYCPECRSRESVYSMSKARAFNELSNSSSRINITWATTSPEREKDFTAIKIPIDKGLMGCRIPFVTEDAERKLASVKTPADLKRFKFGQGSDWPDSDILSKNGYYVERVVSYPSLFLMLLSRRFDLLPRSVLEINLEHKAHGNKDIIIDKYIAISYPDAFYYFTSKSDVEVSTVVKLALEKSIKDGSFDKFFRRYFSRDIESLNMKSRRVIKIDGIVPLQNTGCLS